MGVDAAFPWSDHADYPGLLELVERVQPKRVYNVHGFAREFAQTLRSRGLDAVAPGWHEQLALL
jgi:Cft2 family RNA processing exonuclease